MKINDKIAVTLIITGSVLLTIWYIFVYRKNREARGAKDDIEKQKKQLDGSTETYAKSEYLQMANAIENAVNRYGTDETALYNQIGKILNNADAHALNVAFGIRGDRSLGSWLQSDGELESVNKVLRAKGVSYQFNIIDNSPFYDFYQ